MQHHTVPEFCLKQFADPDQEPYVWLYRLDQRKWRRRPPSKVGTRTNYYGIPVADGSMSNALEESLGRIESRTAIVLRDKVIPQRELGNEDREYLALFVALMMFRLPVLHEKINESTSDDAARVLSLISRRYLDDPEGWEKYKEQHLEEAGQGLADLKPDDLAPSHCHINASHSHVLKIAFSNAEEIAELIDRMRWTFLISQAGNYFITSDEPFHMVDPSNKHPFFGQGLGAKGIEVTLPLTRNIALLAHWGERDTLWVNTPFENVRTVNCRSTYSAREFIVAPSQQFPGSDVILERLRRTGEPETKQELSKGRDNL